MVSEETGTILHVVLLYVVHMFGKGVPREGGIRQSLDILQYDYAGQGLLIPMAMVIKITAYL